MSKQLKTILTLLIVAFVVYAMFKRPIATAHVTRAILGGAIAVVRAIGTFFDALLAR